MPHLFITQLAFDSVDLDAYDKMTFYKMHTLIHISIFNIIAIDNSLIDKNQQLLDSYLKNLFTVNIIIM